jgi:uncharacterized SAM-binding protein YcdF (DUF218 family)
MSKGRNRKSQSSTAHRTFNPQWSNATPRWALPPWANAVLVGVGLSLLTLTFVFLLNPNLGWLSAVAWVVAGGLMSLHPVVKRVLFGLIGALAVTIAIAVFTPALGALEGWLDVSERPQNADVIVILGGGIHCNANDLASNSLARLVRGLELWRQGFAPRVTVSEAGAVVIGPTCGEVSAVSRRTIGRLYPDGGPEIINLPKVKTTRDEAEQAAKIVKTRGWKRVLIVTSPTHTRRARATFRDAGITAIMVSASEPRYDTGFRLPADRLNSLEAIVRELAGLLKYGANGWL